MSDPRLLACVDLETNGLTLQEDTLAISVRLLNMDGTPTDVEFYSLIHTDQPLNTEATSVNGITKEQLSEAPKKEEVVESLRIWWIKNCFGVPTCPIGHNYLGYDKPRMELLLGDSLYSKIFHYHAMDSMVIARAMQHSGLLPVESCSLKILCEFFGITTDKPYHNASTDTYMCGMVYHHLLRILNPDFKTRLIRVFNPKYLGV
jgi:DNA polymerase III epsilon subunit-like protein